MTFFEKRLTRTSEEILKSSHIIPCQNTDGVSESVALRNMMRLKKVTRLKNAHGNLWRRLYLIQTSECFIISTVFFFETLTFKQKFTIDSLKEVNDHEWNLIFAKFCTARVNKNALNENLKGEPPLYRKSPHLFVVETKHPYKICEGRLGSESKIHALFKFVRGN